MGNRAVITTACADAQTSNKVGVYLHWNGGWDSVEAFLTYCKLKDYRTPDTDNYGWVRLCQVIGNFMGGSTSVGIDVCQNLDCDNSDNGVYIIKGWEIVGRQYMDMSEQYEYDLRAMLHAINEAQPTKEQLESSVIEVYFNQEPELQKSNVIEGNAFKGIKSLKELKARYQELAKKHHPDLGGNQHIMKQIDQEFKQSLAKFKQQER